MQPESASLSSSRQAQGSPPANSSSERVFQTFQPTKPEAESGTNALKAIPSRPKAISLAEHSPTAADTSVSKGHPVLRPSRLVTAPHVGREGVTPRSSGKLPAFIPDIVPSSNDPLPDLEQHLPSGTLLRENRYCLQTIVGRHRWRMGVAETMWLALDAQRNGSPVAICEVQLPECGLMEVQSFLRRATIALTSIGRHPRIPMLWDAFTEQTRHFFVFEPVDGESLFMRMQRMQQPVIEDEAIEYGIQIAEILDFLSQQSEPLVHGRIQPEYIVANRLGTAYLLTNFSPLLAAGATQFVIGMSIAHLSPFSSRDFVQSPLDGRGDLYALLASIYYLLTSRIPTGNENEFLPSAQDLNPALSMECNAILERGLHPHVEQRYQSATMLLSDLRALRSVREGRFQQSGSMASVQRLRQSGRPTLSRQSEKAPASPPTQKSPPMSAEPVSVAREKLTRKVLEPQLQAMPLSQKEGSRLFLICVIAVALFIMIFIIINGLARLASP